jgi:hypothetical protein
MYNNYEQQKHKLGLAVVAGDGPGLLSRNWLQHLTLNWKEIKALARNNMGSLDALLEKYDDIFSDELGTIKTFEAKLDVDPEATPKFFKARSLFEVPSKMSWTGESVRESWRK